MNDPAVKRFVEKYLRRDGIFVLRMISLHTGVIFATDFLMILWNDYFGNKADTEETQSKPKTTKDLAISLEPVTEEEKGEGEDDDEEKSDDDSEKKAEKELKKNPNNYDILNLDALDHAASKAFGGDDDDGDGGLDDLQNAVGQDSSDHSDDDLAYDPADKKDKEKKIPKYMQDKKDLKGMGRGQGQGQGQRGYARARR